MASAFISGGLGFLGSVGGDNISSNGDVNSINWGKATLMGIANFVLGYFLSGSGAQNSKEIGKALMKKTEINRTYNILLNASKRYVTNNLSPRGFIGVFNLYSGKLSSMLATEIPKIIFKNTVKGLSEMTVSTILLSLLSSFEAHDD